MGSHRALPACLSLLNGFLPAWGGRKVRKRPEWTEEDRDLQVTPAGKRWAGMGWRSCHGAQEKPSSGCRFLGRTRASHRLSQQRQDVQNNKARPPRSAVSHSVPAGPHPDPRGEAWGAGVLGWRSPSDPRVPVLGT